MRVVPEKADRRADHGPAEDRQLADHGHALQLEIVGKDHVAADVGEHGQRAGGDDGAADGQAVEAVGEVDGVRRAHQHKASPKATKGTKARKPRCGIVAGQWCHSRSGRKLLMNGTVSCVENSLNCVEHHQRHGHRCAGQPLPEQLGARGEAEAAPLAPP